MTRFTLLFALLVAASANAAPFLVSDPWPAGGSVPDNCHLIIAGVDRSVPALINSDGSRYCKIDLLAIVDGTYTSTVNACNSAGCSPSVSFPFTLSRLRVPAPPANLRIVP